MGSTHRLGEKVTPFTWGNTKVDILGMGVGNKLWQVGCHEDGAALGVTFVVAKANTDLFNNCKSWDMLSRVRVGDMFMVDGSVRSCDGYSMIRVCGGGALQFLFCAAGLFVQIDADQFAFGCDRA